MATLVEISNLRGEPHSSVVFLHGLGGDSHDTWRLERDDGLFWPRWLAEDFNDHAVWTVGYEAPISRWRGPAMHLTSRAVNILASLLAEERLQHGRLILIGHSLGGLVIKQMLRTADIDALNQQDAASFRNRVDKVAFLATPHAGSDHASWGDWLRFLARPSAATACLAHNDPNLRDLNNWYRKWANKREIAHLVLTESKPTSYGMIVKPDSSDPGLANQRLIPIDSDHFSIVKPESRKSDTYKNVCAFIARAVARPIMPAQSTVAESEPQIEASEASYDPRRFEIDRLPTPPFLGPHRP